MIRSFTYDSNFLERDGVCARLKVEVSIYLNTLNEAEVEWLTLVDEAGEPVQLTELPMRESLDITLRAKEIADGINFRTKVPHEGGAPLT